MTQYEPSKIAGEKLRQLIKEHYGTQEEFAFEYGMGERTVRRYIQSLNDVRLIQELAVHFKVEFLDFFKND